ncbi:MAG: undecaprenyl-diphosphate phosphatase [Bacteroidales bacterium]|jgi:undecaprenyl-diphosphatase|nr:undecaprenyl-diphosphate phosphatase [Bacteroidales bacterium]MDD4703414.1 undecaprenyl-diphosphate phosphatase [Bacteroidales bacterium]MDX9798031.1 undecaprenyl-diphosphate phosphatase [Bacteroidales bacterium]
MTLFETIIIAIVEGLTEFLPVSSTGHMIITQGFLGIKSDEFVKLFTICIQFGAILSVLVLYWKRFLQTMSFYYKLFVAFIPAAIIGFLAGDFIDSLLENVIVVAVMLILGGVFMLFCDKWFNKPQEDQTITYKKGFIIGLFQCIAMIPGVSRSMATIVGGMTQKLSRKTAAEFSFFLAVPTMLAASGYKLMQALITPEGKEILMNNMTSLVIGNIVAFIVAMLAIKFFINFLTKYGFKAFGYYRIIIGALILVLISFGFDLSVA